MANGQPSTVATVCDSLPSAEVKYSPWLFAYTICCPSRDHVASCPVILPNRCGAPAGSGTIHMGASTCGPVKSAAKNRERSGEISSMLITGEGTCIVSPPADETW